MRSCSWDKLLLQSCLLLAFATEQSAALPFSLPSLAAFTAGSSPHRAASTPDLHFTYPTFKTVKAGTPFNITWAGASGPTTLAVHQATADGVGRESIIASKLHSYIIY